ncbi:hypothetical protein AXG93_2423s1000 [Marchantia polymorpha subsp. ruderalis]|uniref:F-box domain-containing protein n=1 Tax=Marchantia polymorpha subsp. ruderalis TaxID=1480154 RepID=A0A176VNM9_MARPO|nr:hypothetical protein AXG93_2423s1000 [Marchantia polymorpha subsp. ruderalis]
MELEREDHRPRDSWDSLPVELLIKVLRDQDLPISTLAECRAVCKKWKQIIDGPDLRNKIWNQSAILYDACIDSTAYFCLGDRWIGRFMIKALLIFNLTEETWNILFEEIMEDMPGALQVAAYEGCVCLLAMDWTDVEFDRRSYDGNFLRHRMVRKMDRSLIRRTKDLWVMEDGRPFKFYATGGSDVFFVFEEEGEELEVAKYSAELDMIYFLADPPFRGAHEFHLRGFLPHVIHTWEFMPHVIHDPWCAIIPTPGVNAEQEWITQPQRHLLQEVRETPREEDVGEV